MPKYSIITVNKNDAENLDKTILSVVSQSYKDYEYIIIDGASTDHTRNIIHQYKSNITHFVSNKDSGIYDAMNKGISLATGDWLLFPNAGDTFTTSDTLLNLNLSLEQIPKTEFLVFPVLRDSKHQYPLKFKNNPGYVASFYGQQSILYHRSLFKHRNFDLKYRFLADLEFSCYALLQQKVKFEYYQQPVFNYPMNGVTTKFLKECEQERFKIYKKYKQLSLVRIFKHFVKIVLIR